MRWTTISTGEMAMIAYPCVVTRERFLADVTMRHIIPPIVFSTVFPWALADMIFLTPNFGIVA